MILAPLLSLFLEPRQAVIFIISMESIQAIIFLFKERLNFKIKEIFIGGIFGIITGIFLFGLLSQKILRFTIGISVLIISILLLLNINFRVEKERLLFVSLGLLSGSMGVLTGINGPQIVLGLANQGYDGDFIRRCMISYLMLIDFVTLFSFSIFGYLTMNLFPLILYSFPILLLSYITGKSVLNLINLEKLKRIILVVTFFLGILAIFSKVQLCSAC